MANPSRRRLYERQVLHNLSLDSSFRDLALSLLEEDHFTTLAGRAAFRALRDVGEIAAGYNTGLPVRQERDQGFLDLLRKEAPSRETDLERLLDYVEHLRTEPAPADDYRVELDRALEKEMEESDKVESKLTKADELENFIERHRSKCPSFVEVRDALKISASRLSHLLKQDRDQKRRFRVVQRGPFKYLTLRYGSGVQRASIEHLDPTQVLEPRAFLPANFHDLIGTELKGLKPKSFVCFCAPGDVGKTQFLINVAIENAGRGLRVAFVQHEDDAESFYLHVARRLLGRRPNSVREAQDAYSRWIGSQYLALFIAGDEVQINSFLEEIRDQKPDVVVYDYLTQEHMDVDLPSQRSILTRIVITFGNELVDRGIPVITALQLERGRDGKYFLNSRWERRFNVCLWAIDRQMGEDGLLTEILVSKNKQGGLVKFDRMVMRSDRQSWAITGVEDKPKL